MTAPVYLVPTLMEVTAGGTVLVDGDEGRHAATVRRARVGERIDVVNGSGLRARCEVTHTHKNAVVLRVLSVVEEPAPSPRITLVQALAKGGRDEQAVETATEYGVFAVIPWASDRCIASWRGKEDKGKARWEATARAATKQSRRSWIPRISDVRTTSSLVSDVRDLTESGGIAFICHEEAESKLVDILRGRRADGTWDPSKPCVVVVGPEGGISPDEMTALTEAGGIPVLLADYVLRSASAGPYAIATLSATHILETND